MKKVLTLKNVHYFSLFGITLSYIKPYCEFDNDLLAKVNPYLEKGFIRVAEINENGEIIPEVLEVKDPFTAEPVIEKSIEPVTEETVEPVEEKVEKIEETKEETKEEKKESKRGRKNK